MIIWIAFREPDLYFRGWSTVPLSFFLCGILGGVFIGCKIVPRQESAESVVRLKTYFAGVTSWVFSRTRYYLGTKAIEVCKGKPQVQPELLSGIRTSPPAGMILIQQPGLVTLLSCSGPPFGPRSYIQGLPPRQNKHWAEAETPPQPCP